MADLSSPETWADSGANSAVNAARLTNYVNGATILPAFISGKSSVSPLSGDSIVFFQASSSNLVKSTLGTVLGLVSLPAVDPVAGTAGSRTLGAGAQQAAPGNDTRFPASVTGLRKGGGVGSNDIAATPPDIAFTPTGAGFAGAVTLNCAVSNIFFVTLNANATVTLSSVPDGGTVIVITQQDGTGGWTLAFATTQTKEWPNSTPIAVSAAPGAKDMWMFVRINATLFASQLPAFG